MGIFMVEHLEVIMYIELNLTPLHLTYYSPWIIMWTLKILIFCYIFLKKLLLAKIWYLTIETRNRLQKLTNDFAQKYCKNPKISDTWKFAVITLKV